jgi:single-stranded-DNA-specific exonuclease
MPADFPHYRWRVAPDPIPDLDWREAVAQAAALPSPLPAATAQILWQRGHRSVDGLAGYLNPDRYTPTSPWELGPEMEGAVDRLVQARDRGERVAIWGDFDADGLTATAVLWEGLGQFFPQQDALRYGIPNRFTESHGLSRSGLERLADWGCTLVVTCDTGSTATAEIAYARQLGLEVIVTDHHTLPTERPPVVALVNPRQLPADHPLADLSGVAVAYKLVEALYERLPQVPQQPLHQLLDLVAIGLIADLVALRGDCRYLAQVGLQTLQRQAQEGLRPGITQLLKLCKRTGDRPTDIAFGIGPRINAVSRIHGDASFGVTLLTSRDRPTAERLAHEAEAANLRRKDLQGRVLAAAEAQLAAMDLSTTRVLVLADPQWSPGVLGLVASQLAQTYDRPTILLQTELTAAPGTVPMARGSARSVQGIDLYALVQDQQHLLTRFGGHPFAAGLTLPVAHLDLFRTGINRALRSQQPGDAVSLQPPLTVDLTVTVADLGRSLFKALKLLEPYGMGNPIPRLLLRRVRFVDVWDKALRDRQGTPQRFYRTHFTLRDEQTGAEFPGHWWGHRRDEIPTVPCDVVVELDVNFYKNPAVYEVRLIDWRRVQREDIAAPATVDWIVDQRSAPPPHPAPPALAHCPADWGEFPRPTQLLGQPLTLAYGPPEGTPSPWTQWVGLAKYLARTGTRCPRSVLGQRLGLGERAIAVGLACLEALGFGVRVVKGDTGEDTLALTLPATEGAVSSMPYAKVVERFNQAVAEDQFRRRYFHQVSPQVIQAALSPAGESVKGDPS